MGYYTDYCLYARDKRSSSYHLPEDTVAEIDRVINELDLFEGGDIIDGLWGNAKWYYHDEDMIKISRQFPDVLFKLEGNGEEQGDMWITYYCDGRMQHCPASISYPPYDPNKMEVCKPNGY